MSKMSTLRGKSGLLRRAKAFTTVEILIAVGLIAILMVVAVPRLLDSRGAVSDSSAKQQINAVKMSVDTWFAERDTYSGLDLTTLQSRIPDVQLVDATTPTGKPADGRALTVGVQVSATEVVLAASNGEDTCWAMKLSSTEGNRYAGKAATPAQCTAGSAFSWVQFEYPQLP